MNVNSIDFVILWVDGSDKKWRDKKEKYSETPIIANNQDINRYRDWGTLKYWFRAVEEFAPWVNMIYLVTDDQKPDWLNLSNSKVKVIDHKQIIKSKYLPTFNSQAIEVNLHRIPNLSNQFVYFNDDMFLGKKVEPTDFFKNGNPVQVANINAGTGMKGDELYARTMFNNTLIINKHFEKNKIIKNHLTKWVNIRYGSINVRTISQLIYPYFTGYKPQHAPTPMLKETYNKIWAKEYKILEETSSHKFRHEHDVNQDLFQWWQLCENRFVPQKAKYSKFIHQNSEDIETIKKTILSNRYKTICLNDDISTLSKKEEHIIKEAVLYAFEKKHSHKSNFEK